MKSDQRIGIAGGGLVGRLLAWRLAKRGLNVHLFEKNAPDIKGHSNDCAAHTAAGMLSPISELAVANKPLYDLGKRSIDLWKRWSEELEIKVNQTGSLILAHQQDISLLNEFSSMAEFHLDNQHDLQRLDQAGINQLDPSLGLRFDQGLYAPSEAHLNNRKVLRNLWQQIEKLNVNITIGKVSAINNQSIICHEQAHDFDWVFDCRGVGASINELRGVRGEVMTIKCEEVTLPCPVRLMHPRYQLYVVPKANQQFVIGATEIESEDKGPMRLQSMLELGSALYAIDPAFAQAQVLSLESNLRPALNDNLPAIFLDKKTLHINGLYRHGFLIAPAVVEQAIEFLLGKSCQHSWLMKPLLPNQKKAS